MKEIKYIDVEKLKLNERNPRTITKESFRKLCKSIKDNKEFFEARPIIVSNRTGENVIIAGNQRYRAALEVGLKKVPVAIFENLTPKKEKEILIRDNVQNGAWNFEVLANEFEVEDLENWGFDKSELPEIEIEDLENEDDVPEMPKKPKSKYGDIYILGKHRLLCGDATKREDVEKLISNLKEYNVITDPPYNIGFNYNKISDKKNISEYSLFCKKWFNMFKPKAMIFSPGPRNEKFYPEWRDRGIWIKKNATAGASVFHLRCAEPILFYGKFDKKRNTDIFDYSSGFSNELKNAREKMNIIDKYAPAKPISLWLELIKMFDDNIIIDCFGGNGTTLIACEKIGHKCRIMELDEHYCDIIIERWEKFAGKKAVKL